ncbi:MAG: hypothetical protein R2864_12045 [Syntrophotaleaceae bacterium]
MICPLDRLTQVSWWNLTDKGRDVVEEVRAGGSFPADVVAISTAGSDSHAGWYRNSGRYRSRILQKILSKDLPVAVDLGVGVSAEQDSCEKHLLLRLPWPGLPLADFYHDRYPALASLDKRRFIIACGRFLRRLHDAGVVVSGCLERELMVSADRPYDRFSLSGAQPLALALASRPVGGGTRLKALAVLFASSFGSTTRSGRLRFVAAYLGRARFDREGRRFLHRLERAAKREAMRQWHRRARRCLAGNRTFVNERRDGFRIHRLRSDAALVALGRLLPDPDGVFADALIYKPGSRTHAGLIELDGRRYFLKRYNAPGGWFRLVNIFRRSRARRTWLATWHFMERGLPVARPILCMEKRRLRLLGPCYILMEFVEETGKL